MLPGRTVVQPVLECTDQLGQVADKEPWREGILIKHIAQGGKCPVCAEPRAGRTANIQGLSAAYSSHSSIPGGVGHADAKARGPLRRTKEWDAGSPGTRWPSLGTPSQPPGTWHPPTVARRSQFSAMWWGPAQRGRRCHCHGAQPPGGTLSSPQHSGDLCGPGHPGMKTPTQAKAPSSTQVI